uniref:Alpha/beta hydrolase fold-3 domain-containing protein n=2 Tax=Oryza punctata TaxID=4537 RepID=A0A0E0L2G0_ORYPU
MAGSDEVNRNECKTVVPLHTWVLISNFKLSYNILRRADGTFERDLGEYLDRRVPANARPLEGVSSFDHVIDQSVGLEVRIYRAAAEGEAAGDEGAAAVTLPILEFLTNAPAAEPFPVIIFFHGGSFVHSSASSTIYDSLCRRFVKLSKGVVVSVNYRRAPEHRYPCAYDDGWTALKWVMSQPFMRSGEDAQARVFLSGDSSGGNIAHHVAVRAADEGVKICGNILLNAMFGGTERTESERRLDGKYFVTLQDRDWYWKAYLPEDADRDHPACNPFGPNGRRLRGLPFAKSLIIVSGLDLTCDRQLAYADALREDGHDVKVVQCENATVGFYLLPNTVHYHEVMEEISDFLNANLYYSNQMVTRLRRGGRSRPSSSSLFH